MVLGTPMDLDLLSLKIKSTSVVCVLNRALQWDWELAAAAAASQRCLPPRGLLRSFPGGIRTPQGCGCHPAEISPSRCDYRDSDFSC